MEHVDSSPGMPLSQWAQALAPQLEVVSASVPEPTVEDGDVIAISRAVDQGQRIIRRWERLEPADQRVGFVALGIAPEHDPRPRGVDPERVGKTVGTRAAMGGFIGAVLGAIVGVVIGAIGGWGTQSAVAIACGAALGAVAGAMFVVTLRTAWGEAYRHSFVDQQATALAVCLISCRDDDHRERAKQAAADSVDTEVLVVGQRDRPAHRSR